MRLAASIVVLATGAALLLTAAGAASSESRIVFRTVHLGTPKKPPELYSVLPSGRGRRLLARGAEQPAWSPDRRRAAFAGSGILGQTGIWVVNADGSAKRRLTRTAGDIAPTWSPDGRRIAFCRQSPTSIDLWVVPAGGGTARPLLRTPVANELEPDWSPDGRRIAFHRGGQVLSMRAGGGDLRYVTRAAWGTNGDPDW